MTSRDVCDVPCNPSECAFSRTRKRPGPSLPVSSENEKYSQPSRAAVAASDRAAGGPLARSPSTESVARIGRPPPAAPHTSAVAVASCPLAVTSQHAETQRGLNDPRPRRSHTGGDEMLWIRSRWCTTATDGSQRDDESSIRGQEIWRISNKRSEDQKGLTWISPDLLVSCEDSSPEDLVIS